MFLILRHALLRSVNYNERHTKAFARIERIIAYEVRAIDSLMANANQNILLRLDPSSGLGVFNKLIYFRQRVDQLFDVVVAGLLSFEELWWGFRFIPGDCVSRSIPYRIQKGCPTPSSRTDESVMSPSILCQFYRTG